ncbi:MAG TPA: polyprenol phosphomannose-dependent alpha 1,6 mannosyltransferase MptB, partial [Spirosoma sp.]|nr:polyprenol phosphomannose-dependent alpha 1,6 mannosyltransferase MptB [Spirosoma sp.]
MTETQTPLTFLRISWLLLSAVGYLFLAYAVPRTQFGLLMSLLTGLFLGYILVLRSLSDSSAPADRFLFASAIGFRLLLLFALPQLSDDVFRFVWDGRLLAHGYNPYLYQPNQLLNTPIAATCGLDESLLRLLNSPSYFTVYPPVNQALFGLAAWLSPESLLGNVIWLRIPIVVCEAGSLWLMVKLLRWLNMHPNLALLYGLNPLVILELTGNVHAESIMIFFVLLAAWLLVAYDRWIASAGSLALAIGTKLLPLLLLPLIIRRLGWRKGLRYALLAGVLTMALFAP